ncbi:MAG: hypothetical protein WCS98_04710 [Bacillota bacterium]|jgi:uncharacterized alkaline shock family protein YloU|nr:hypothetical protein [Bacillota bacterium]MDD3297349.1 hypothetical protein [Bacillota bacterium]MDD3851004.1 hypothetical protein [Bacillota bacterium]MDD4707146.1 hypothetical protein [Bacillota bacterium]
MQVTSLVGISGTGKSYKALLVAKENNIEYVIDDGLFIKGNKIIAGASAKKEPTKIAAVRRALFMEPQHREEVAEAIRRHKPGRVLILGTSDGMVDRITQALSIPAPQTRFYIEDIASSEEIKLARQQRFLKGKHVIPVPTLEVKKDFSGYFLDTLKIFTKRRDDSVTVDEKTVVRPTYSYLGRYTIYGRAIIQIALAAAKKIDGIGRIYNTEVAIYPHGIVLNTDVAVKYGIAIGGRVAAMKDIIKSEIEYMTSLNVLAINVTVKSLIIE